MYPDPKSKWCVAQITQEYVVFLPKPQMLMVGNLNFLRGKKKLCVVKIYLNCG